MTASIANDGQTTTSAVIPFANGVKTDTIVERSGNTGVTIDSVLLKDGRVDTAKGSDIASATTTDIGAMTGNYADVTGTTTITGLGTKTAGNIRIVQFDGILTLTHNATSLILPAGANITTAAGDVAAFVSEGSGNWRCIWYTKADGTAIVAGISNVVEDTTPQLGGDLDLNGNAIDFPTTANISDVLDEDNMASDSATALATQQSIKAYVDSNTPALDYEFVGKAAIPAQATMTIAANGTPDITHTFASGYDYIIQLEAFAPGTDAAQLQMRFSDDGGTSYEADAGDYGWGINRNGSAEGSASATSMAVTGVSQGLGNDSATFSSIGFTLIDPAAASESTTVRWDGGMMNTAASPVVEAVQGMGYFKQGVDAVNGVQFLWSSGSFKAQGDLAVWRRKRS